MSDGSVVREVRWNVESSSCLPLRLAPPNQRMKLPGRAGILFAMWRDGVDYRVRAAA